MPNLQKEKLKKAEELAPSNSKDKVLRIVNSDHKPKEKVAAVAVEQMRLRKWPIPPLEVRQRGRLVSSMGVQLWHRNALICNGQPDPCKQWRPEMTSVPCGSCAIVS